MTPASQGQCLSLLEAVDRYPSWHPTVVREAEVLERDGQGHPTKVRAKLHVERGPLTKDFDLTMAASVDPAGVVKMTRISHGPSDRERFDVTWRVGHGEGAGSQIRLDLAANLSVPGFLPLGGVGDSLAGGFVDAAVRALASGG